MFRKKWLASILSVMMAFAFLPISSFALDDVESADEQEPVVTEEVAETPDPAPAPDVEEPAAEPEEEVVEEAPMMLAATAAPELKTQGNDGKNGTTLHIKNATDALKNGGYIVIDEIGITFTYTSGKKFECEGGKDLDEKTYSISNGSGPCGSITVTNKNPGQGGAYQYQCEYVAPTPATTYTVTYDANGGSFKEGVKHVFTDLELNSDTPEPSEKPTREGFEFKGWDPEPSATVTGNATYVAKWSAKPAPVEFGTVSYKFTGNVPSDAVLPESADYKVGADVTVVADATTALEGYTFEGWVTPDGLKVTDGQFEMPKGNVEITGNWTYTEPGPGPTPTKYTVTYVFTGADAPEDAVLPSDANYEEGQTVTIADTATTKQPYYQFHGWNVPDGIIVENGQFEMPAGNVVITGNWTYLPPAPILTFTVTFDANGHGTAPAAQTDIEAGKTATDPGAISAEGYVFGGWYLEKECINAYNFDTEVYANITLYAKWTPVGPGPVPPGPTPVPPGPNPIPPAPAPGGGGAVVPGAGAVIAAAAAPAAPVQIEDQETPLANTNLGAWALLNLLLTILTCIMSISLLITYFTRKKEDEEETAAYTEEQEEEKLKKKGLWRLISAAWGILMIIVFFLTEDMTLPMIFVDKWTILMIVMTAIQAGIMIMSRKKYDEEDEDAQMA